MKGVTILGIIVAVCCTQEEPQQQRLTFSGFSGETTMLDMVDGDSGQFWSYGKSIELSGGMTVSGTLSEGQLTIQPGQTDYDWGESTMLDMLDSGSDDYSFSTTEEDK